MESYLINDVFDRLSSLAKPITCRLKKMTATLATVEFAWESEVSFKTGENAGLSGASTSEESKQIRHTASTSKESKRIRHTVTGTIRFYQNNIVRLTVGRRNGADYKLVCEETLDKELQLPIKLIKGSKSSKESEGLKDLKGLENSDESLASTSDDTSSDAKTMKTSSAIDAYDLDEDSYGLSGEDYTFAFNEYPFAFKILKRERGGNGGMKEIVGSANDGHFTRKHRLPLLRQEDGRWIFSLALREGEQFYGLGEKFGTLSKRSELVINKNHDALGVNTEICYKNIPFLWSTEGWGLWINTPGTVEHALGFAPLSHRSYVCAVEDSILDVFFMFGEDPEGILKSLQTLIGGVPALPDWSFGIWMSRAYYKDADECLEIAHEMRKRNVPCDVFNLDGRTWLERKTRFGFQWDEKRYPDPKQFTDKLKAMHYKVCVWEYPLISVQNPRFKELAEKGWLLKNRAGETYIYEFALEPFGAVLEPLPKSGLIDFTHREAYTWYRDAHRELFAAGIDVVKSDFGEQIPDDAVASNGDSGRRLHNVYTLLYNKCVYEATAKFRNGIPMVWARSAWSGSHRYPIQWGGDPQSDWGGLSASIRGGLSWGMSGGTYYTSDIGGFYGEDFAKVPDDLYVRWTQAGVYSSHTRFHGIGKREPWFYGKEAEKIVLDLLNLRMKLLPYFLLTSLETTMNPLPVMRAMPLAFPNDPDTPRYEHQYMLGHAYLISPIINREGFKKTLLPACTTWFEPLSGRFLAGHTLSARQYALAEVPLWIRTGSIVPEMGVHTWIAEKSDQPLQKISFYGSPIDALKDSDNSENLKDSDNSEDLKDSDNSENLKDSDNSEDLKDSDNSEDLDHLSQEKTSKQVNNEPKLPESTAPNSTLEENNDARHHEKHSYEKRAFIAERKRFLANLHTRWGLEIVLNRTEMKVLIKHEDHTFLKGLKVVVFDASKRTSRWTEQGWEIDFS